MEFEPALAFNVVRAHKLKMMGESDTKDSAYNHIMSLAAPFLKRSEVSTMPNLHPLEVAYCVQYHGPFEPALLLTLRIGKKKCCFLVDNSGKIVYLISLSLANLVFDEPCIFECILVGTNSPPILKITDTLVFKNTLLDKTPLLLRSLYAWITVCCHHTPNPKTDPVVLQAELYTPTLATLDSAIAFHRSHRPVIESVLSVVIRPLYSFPVEEEEQKLRYRYFV